MAPPAKRGEQVSLQNAIIVQRVLFFGDVY